MFTKRLWLCLTSGAILGIVCIIGVSIRSGFKIDAVYLFSIWFNRLLMGLLIGAPWKNLNLFKSIARGAILGLLVSFAFYSAVNFSDLVSFLAGIVYGIIIEIVAFKFANIRIRSK